VYTNFFDRKKVGRANVERETRANALHALESVAAGLREHGSKVTISAGNDLPLCAAIVRCARRVKADLIVAECHAGRGVAPTLLHIADWELLKTSPLPVLLVKNARPYRHPTVLVAIDPTHSFSKATRFVEEALRDSAGIRRALRGALHTVHAYQPPSVYVTTGAAAHGDKGFARALRANIPRPRCHVIAQSALQAIPDVARHTGASIVVMGAVSRSEIDPDSIGSTAECALNARTCDVLVVKPRRSKRPLLRPSLGIRLVAMAALMA
jgi:universal stress protein E